MSYSASFYIFTASFGLSAKVGKTSASPIINNRTSNQLPELTLITEIIGLTILTSLGRKLGSSDLG